MRVHIIKPKELSDDLVRTWHRYRTESSFLGSPYFDPMFATLAEQAGRDVKIALIEENSQIVGFFPFEKTSRRTGRPVGGPLSDFHGIILEKNFIPRMSQLILQAGLKTWSFDHLVDPNGYFDNFVRAKSTSPAITLDSGFESYLVERRKSGTSKLKKLLRQQRQLRRHFRNIRFEYQTDDRQVLSQVIALKSAQCIRTGSVDIFSFPWIVDFVNRIFTTRGQEFSGVLSVLYVDDDLMAAHMGMQSSSVLHWWFPVYNSNYDRYSPGLLLLLEIIEKARENHLRRIDLGKGDELYKKQMANIFVPILEGCISIASPLGRFSKFAKSSIYLLLNSAVFRATGLRKVGRLPVSLVRKQLKKRRFR